MIATASKRRYELAGDQIRALYGHSLPGRIVKTAAAPPAVLFHGTSPKAWAVIRTDGLVPMGRQYVHLSIDVPTAWQVGRRKAARPVMLAVDAEQAHAEGVEFWRGNDLVWLAGPIPARHLREHRADGGGPRCGEPPE
jgi:putative RNA 2'-phosphotransferase